MKIGTQLCAYLKDRGGDPMAALRDVRAMGYRSVEPCIALEPIPGTEHFLWPLAWFAEHAGEIAALGLEVRSCHLFAGSLAGHAGEARRLARELGLRQLVVKSPRALSEEALQQAAMEYMTLADALAEEDAELLVHNGHRDIAARFAGTTAFERLLDLCGGKVGAQVDVGWVLAGGEDPEALLWRNAARVRSLHFKDLVRDGERLSEVPVGAGVVDTAACFQFARAHGCALLVDMDSFAQGREESLAASFRALDRLASFRERTVSYLNTVDVDTGEVRVLRRFPGVIEAPNWLRGTGRILYNAEGSIFSYDIETGESARVDTGLCDNCNNDHVVSPDESELAVSHMTFDQGFASRVYILPIGGGAPRLVTPESPSFLHGWSPDGEELAYCAFRDHGRGREVDIYVIPAAGGEEKRLTRDAGFNDGPEYSPDGRYIWFNSTRTGLMQVFRMRRDGSGQTQMTHTERNNWFGHVSPDGRRVLYLSYAKDELDAAEHLPNMRVELWLMNADGSEPRRVLSFFGGQGSMNVNSWAGDSRRAAFVSYELEHK